jgi:3-isopropylmalate/(R)-2-methylmalate dehydratase large subunit
VSVPPRILYLTEDLNLIRRQLLGEHLAYDPGRKLLDDISTDEIIPAWACFYYDERLGHFLLTGLRGGVIAPGEVRAGGFDVIVSGLNKGCGSSRETAPYAERHAGIGAVFATSFARIYERNCQNIGVLASTNRALLARMEAGEQIPRSEFARGLGTLEAGVVRAGGLFSYTRERLTGHVRPPARRRHRPRPMTLVEKIVTAHARSSKRDLSPALAGDPVFVRADLRFSHDYVTAMAEALLREGFGPDAAVVDPDSVLAFRDHLTLLSEAVPAEGLGAALLEHATRMARVQEDFATRHGIRLYGEVTAGAGRLGSEAICHNKMLDDLALPGQVVVGTDSHTCTAGALGCLAFGVGSTEMASAWRTGDVRLIVPETVRVELTGRLRPGVCAKDVMIHLLGTELSRTGLARHRVLEFGGSGVAGLPMDERATLTNMAVEVGAMTGIVPADDVAVEHLRVRRGFSSDQAESYRLGADPGACYAHVLTVDLEKIEPMVSTPGDPKNSRRLSELLESHRAPIGIGIAYAGTCTGGKRADMDMYAAVLSRARNSGRTVAPGVRLYVQFGSQAVRRYAEERGYIDVFEAVGAVLVEPCCGACIRAGPGVSRSAGEVTVSAGNRNFPGRSGPGRVYLANPFVVASSALAGALAWPDLGADPS